MHKKLRILFAVVALSIPTVALASLTELDVQDVLQNLKKILNPAMALLLTVSFIMGIIFMLRGLLLLKAFSQPLTQATRPGEIAGPLVYIFVGTVMIYIPTSTDVLSSTVFGSGLDSIFPNSHGSSSFVPRLEEMGNASDTIMGYSSISIESQWATMVDTIVLYMEFIGFLAFMRGWMLIAHAGQPGVQPGSISKGIIHIVGGILAINFLPLVEAVSNTLMGTG